MHDKPQPAHGNPRSGVGAHLCILWWAHTHIGVDPVHTGGVVLTVAVLAVIWVDLTPLPLEAQGAGAALGMCGCEEGSAGQGEGWVGAAEGKVGDRISQVSPLDGGPGQHGGPRRSWGSEQEDP